MASPEPMSAVQERKVSKIDDPSIQPLPDWWWLLAIACGVPVVLAFWLFAGEQFRGFVAALSVAVLVAVFGLFREFRFSASLWTGLAIIFVAHLFLVFAVPWENNHLPGIMALPFVLADIAVSTGLIFLLIRKRAGLSR